MCEGPGTTNLSLEFQQAQQAVQLGHQLVQTEQAEHSAKLAFAASAFAAFVESAGQLSGQS